MRTLLLTLTLAACADTAVYHDVVYDDRYGDATAMDIHVPGGAAPTGGYPAIMLVHGGGWTSGDRGHYTEAAERFAESGYVAATIDYRLVPEGRYPAAVRDVLCALAFLRANASAYAIDPDRLAVTGYSAGGHLAALVGVAYDNPTHAPDCAAARGIDLRPSAVIASDGVYRMDLGSVVEDFANGNLIDSSPIAQTRPGAPPFMVVHGTTDVFVDVDVAHEFVEALRGAGDDVTYLELSGAGHILSSSTATGGTVGEVAADMPEAWLATFDFLASKLGTDE